MIWCQTLPLLPISNCYIARLFLHCHLSLVFLADLTIIASFVTSFHWNNTDSKVSGLWYLTQWSVFLTWITTILSPKVILTNKPGKTGNVRDNNNTFVFLIKVVLIGIDSVLSGTLHFDKTCTYNTASWSVFVCEKNKRALL